MKMILIDEALLLTDKSKLIEQIKIRGKLASTMVGQLYPSILYDERHKLWQRIEDLRRNK